MKIVSCHFSRMILLVSVQTPMYSTRAFWKKRPIGQVYRKGRNVTSRHRRNVRSQTPVVSMTTRLINLFIGLSFMKTPILDDKPKPQP